MEAPSAHVGDCTGGSSPGHAGPGPVFTKLLVFPGRVCSPFPAIPPSVVAITSLCLLGELQNLSLLSTWFSPQPAPDLWTPAKGELCTVLCHQPREELLVACVNLASGGPEYLTIWTAGSHLELLSSHPVLKGQWEGRHRCQPKLVPHTNISLQIFLLFFPVANFVEAQGASMRMQGQPETLRLSLRCQSSSPQ